LSITVVGEKSWILVLEYYWFVLCIVCFFCILSCFLVAQIHLSFNKLKVLIYYLIYLLIYLLLPLEHPPNAPLGVITDLYNYSPDAVPPIHTVSYHVATDKGPAQNGDKFRSIFSDNLQPIATRGKKARGTLLVDKHCGNGCFIKRAPLSVSYYNKISGRHIGRAVVRTRCSAGSVLPLWALSKHRRHAGEYHRLTANAGAWCYRAVAECANKHAVGLRCPQRSVDEVVTRTSAVAEEEVSWQTRVIVQVNRNPRLLARVSDGLNQLRQNTDRKRDRIQNIHNWTISNSIKRAHNNEFYAVYYSVMAAHEWLDPVLAI